MTTLVWAPNDGRLAGNCGLVRDCVSGLPHLGIGAARTGIPLLAGPPVMRLARTQRKAKR